MTLHLEVVSKRCLELEDFRFVEVNVKSPFSDRDTLSGNSSILEVIVAVAFGLLRRNFNSHFYVNEHAVPGSLSSLSIVVSSTDPCSHLSHLLTPPFSPVILLPPTYLHHFTKVFPASEIHTCTSHSLPVHTQITKLS